IPGQSRPAHAFVCGGTWWRVRRAIGTILHLEQDPLRGAFEIVILAVLERPHERGEPGESEAQRNGHEEKEIDHGPDPMMAGLVGSCCAALRCGRLGAASLRRSAFATTMTDDSDIAIAATSGVTWPSTATGIA